VRLHQKQLDGIKSKVRQEQAHKRERTSTGHFDLEERDAELLAANPGKKDHANASIEENQFNEVDFMQLIEQDLAALHDVSTQLQIGSDNFNHLENSAHEQATVAQGSNESDDIFTMSFELFEPSNHP
jgi:hypothetical protein